MKLLKEMIQNTGLMLLGVMSIIVLIGLLIWNVFKFIGHFIVWFVNMKLDEQYNKEKK